MRHGKSTTKSRNYSNKYSNKEKSSLLHKFLIHKLMFHLKELEKEHIKVEFSIKMEIIKIRAEI